MLDQSLTGEYAEIWIEGHHESRICAMTNKHSAFLMYLRYGGDSGFRSNNKAAGERDVEEFRLSNGQSDHYPATWLIKKEMVRSALLTYFDTGTMDRGVDWIEA